MSYLEMDRSLGLGNVPAKTTGRPPFVLPPPLTGQREGSFTIYRDRSPWDRRPPALPQSDWTPYGWYTPPPGSTMETF